MAGSGFENVKMSKKDVNVVYSGHALSFELASLQVYH